MEGAIFCFLIFVLPQILKELFTRKKSADECIEHMADQQGLTGEERINFYKMWGHTQYTDKQKCEY